MKNWKRLVAMGAVVGLSINIANVSFGKQYAYTEPFDLPELTGDWRTDIIAVVESQLGYQEAEDGSTYFGAWIGEGEPTRAWCSEFVAWCAYAAKIPESVIPHKRSSNAYQKYFDQFDQFYFLEQGISPSVSGYGKSRAETISVEQLKPGDILLLETNDDYSDGADHTALFLDFSDGYILEISGNNGGAVAESVLLARTHSWCL